MMRVMRRVRAGNEATSRHAHLQYIRPPNTNIKEKPMVKVVITLKELLKLLLVQVIKIWIAAKSGTKY